MLSALLLAALTWPKVLQVWQIAVLACVSASQSFDARHGWLLHRTWWRIVMILRRGRHERHDVQSGTGGRAAIGGLVLASMGAWCFVINGLSFLAVLIALPG